MSDALSLYRRTLPETKRMQTQTDQPSHAENTTGDTPSETLQAGSLKAPVFLVGAERSGSTLLRIMLDNHPEVAFRNEFEFAVDRVGDDGSFPALDAYAEWLDLVRTFRMSGFEITPGLDYRGVVTDFLRQKRDRDGKRLVGATIHRRFKRILHIWPDARFIHLVRDGRDVAVSRMKMGWAGNVWSAAHEWVEVEHEIAELESSLPAGRMIRVRYEDIVRDAEAELTRICDLFGVGFTPAMLTFDDGTTYDPPDPIHASKWRRNLTPHEVRLIESVQADTLKRAGYEPSEHPPLTVGSVRRTILRCQSAWAGRLFRLRKYGPRLFIVHAISKRVGGDWNRRVRHQMHEIELRGLK